jgi:NNP family nitrate/nitrite transporter-like MFS transporter
MIDQAFLRAGHPPTLFVAFFYFDISFMVWVMLGACSASGNRTVVQLVPQRFRQEIGVMTGLIGMTGSVGGFYLASSLGYAKQLTGSCQAGLFFAILALVAVVGLTSIRARWRTILGVMPGVAGI